MPQNIQSLLFTLQSPIHSAADRIAAGNTLAAIGDPRFSAEFWGLPDDATVGFIEIQPRNALLPRYWIARYPVTVAQWRAFVDTTGYRPKDGESVAGIANHPVTRVTANEALQYCEWLNIKMRTEATSRRETVSADEDAYRFWSTLAQGDCWITLPSDAEWERAARFTDERTYPWGNNITAEHANYSDLALHTTSPVGAFPQGRSAEGVEELSGNVWEWMRAPDGEYAPIATSDSYVYTSQPCGLRGGSFFENAACVTSIFRTDYFPGGRRYNIGFRLVISRPGYRAIQEDDA